MKRQKPCIGQLCIWLNHLTGKRTRIEQREKALGEKGSIGSERVRSPGEWSRAQLSRVGILGPTSGMRWRDCAMDVN